MSAISHIKLSELTKKIEEHIKQSFGTQFHWIVAEISSHKFYADPGRHYFDWVEKIEGQNVETAKVKGIAWAGGSQNIKKFEDETNQKFTNGIQVLAQVRVEFHSIHGFSLILVDIDPSFTLGNLERQKRETLLRLVELNPGTISNVGDGFMTKNKSLSFRAVLQKIALIASPNSEGYNDFVHTMKNNQFGYKFHIDEYQSSVQGSLAEAELVNTLVKIYNSNIDYDCVVIVRGGGAKTDFLVFDTYKVAQAVARFPFPIITGIGHHKDVSITDLMAHTNTKTPTKSAELIIDHARSFEELVMDSQKTVIIKAQQILHAAAREIDKENALVIKKSLNPVGAGREGLLRINQIVSGNSKEIIFSAHHNIVQLQQTIINISRTQFHLSASGIDAINQSIINKAGKLIYTNREHLTLSGHTIKTFVSSRLVNQKNNLVFLSHGLQHASRSIVRKQQTDFLRLAEQLTAKPLLLTNSLSLNLKQITTDINLSVSHYFSLKNTKLVHHAAMVKVMNPKNILNKGFAIISSDGKIMKDAKNIHTGSQLTITMSDTEISAAVISKTKK